MTARSEVTPLEALRRLVDACKLIDFADCKDEAVWQALASAQGVAEGVVRDFQQQPTAYICPAGLANLKAGRTAVVYPCYTDSERSLCLYTAPVAAVSAAPSGEVMAAVKAVLSLALDEARGQVHICDADNDDIKVKTLSKEMQSLYAAITTNKE